MGWDHPSPADQYLGLPTPHHRPDPTFHFTPARRVSTATFVVVVQIIARFLRPPVRRKSRASERGGCRCRLQAFLLLLYFITTPVVSAKPHSLARTALTNHKKTIHRHSKSTNIQYHSRIIFRSVIHSMRHDIWDSAITFMFQTSSKISTTQYVLSHISDLILKFTCSPSNNILKSHKQEILFEKPRFEYR